MTHFITEETPIAMLTVGQLKQVLNTYSPKNENAPIFQPNEKRYVYGLRGIKELFKVCHTTAQRYKDTFLKPAVIQNGRKLIIDVDMALELFATYQEA